MKVNETEGIDVINQAELLGKLDKIVQKKSIAYRCSDMQPLQGGNGVISGITYDAVQDKLKVLSTNIEASTERIRAALTSESTEDLKAIYGEDIIDVLAYYLADELVYRIDTRYLQMIKTRAKASKNLVFSSDYALELNTVIKTIVMRVSKSLNDLAFSDRRASGAFCVVNSDVAALLGFDAQGGIDGDCSYLGELSGISFFIDFTNDNSGTDACVCGIKGNGINRGSTVISHYREDWVSTVDHTNGSNIEFLVDRTAMSINPLDNEFWLEGDGESAFLVKFDVDLTDVHAAV